MKLTIVNTFIPKTWRDQITKSLLSVPEDIKTKQ